MPMKVGGAEIRVPIAGAKPIKKVSKIDQKMEQFKEE